MQRHKPTKPGSPHRREAPWAYLFIAPFVAGLSVFYLYSFFSNAYFSLTNKKTFGIPKFIGLENYAKLFSSGKFLQALQNTCLYVLICVSMVILLSILIATLLNNKTRLTGLYRTLIFLPAVTMPSAIGLVWRWMMNYEFGLLNAALSQLGLAAVAWLSDPRYALISVAVVLIWTDVSTKMVILLAGLQGIPTVYYEAARIDGAGPLRQFFGVTLPLLSPTIFFCLCMETIGVFQIFDFVYLMIRRTSGGMPAARSLVVMFFDEAFYSDKRGYAAAITMVLFAIIMVVTIVQMGMRKRWVHEE